MTDPRSPAKTDGGPRFAPRGRVIPAAHLRAWHDGEAFIAAARAEADRILAEAAAERDRLIAEAHAEAERAGAVALTLRIAEATRRLDDLLAHSEDWLADLVVDTVERIIGAMNKRRTTLAAAINALRAFRHALRPVVRVPPEDVAWLETGLTETLEPALQARLVIQPDPRLASGRCVVATEFGTVEAGIKEQLAALRDGLAGQRQADHG